MSDETVARAHVLVSGRVQGVWFRGSTCDQATELGLAGWVRNLSDGRVEYVAQGSREHVEKLIDWSRRGPRWARVDELDVVWESAADQSDVESGEFRVLR